MLNNLGRKQAKLGIIGGFSLFGILVALYFLSTFFDFVSLGAGMSPARFTGILIIALLLMNGNELKFKIDLTLCFLALLVTVATLSFLVMKQPTSGFGGYFSLVINIVILIMVRSHHYTKNDLHLWELAIVFGALIMCALIFLSPGAVGHEWASDRLVVNIGGSQQDPNEFCGYLIFAAGFFSYKSVNKAQYWWFAPVVLLIYVTMMTGSRGGLIAIFAVILAAIYIGWRGGKRRGLTIAIVALLMLLFLMNMDLLLAMLPSSVSDRFLNASISSGTASYRTQAWNDVLTAYFNSPIVEQLVGHGFNATTSVTFNGLVAHNSFIEVLYSCGLIGLTCYVGVAIVAALKGIKGSSASTAAIIGFVVLLFTLSSLSLKAYWIVLTLSIVAGDMVNEQE